MPLVPILTQSPFEKWGIDVVGPIALASRNKQERYILVAIEYVTKWAKTQATKMDTTKVLMVAQFLFEYIITQSRCPLKL
jgi:hypothetical protein